MANHKSALKRAKQNVTRRLRNKTVRTRVKNIVKDVRLAVSDQTGTQAGEQAVSNLNRAKSVIDTAAKKGVLHPRTAARKISRLSKLVNKLSA